MTNIEFLRSEVNGVEYFTNVATGESGMSQIGLARACGVTHPAIIKLVATITGKVQTKQPKISNDKDLTSVTKSPSKRLESFVGMDLTSVTKLPSKRLERFVGMDLNLSGCATKNSKEVTVYKAEFCSAVIKHYAYKGKQVAQDFDGALGSIGLTSYIQGVTGWLPQQFQSSPAARQKLSHILDAPTPWVKLYEREFCTKVYTWFGPNFYWTFCYSFLTPVERCKVELLNPVVNGERAHRIHQYLEAETRDRLTPHIWQLLAIVNTATDKRTFLAGYQKHFEGTSQLELF